jgi:flavin-dependent dehydrogenase
LNTRNPLNNGNVVARQRGNAIDFAALEDSHSRVTELPRYRDFDVVIAGASFAGLAAAQRIRGHVALIDKDPIGEGVTSACGAPVSIVRAAGAEASIKQIHDQLVIHTERSRTVWPLPEPFCTFDYKAFCEIALARIGAEFLHATVLGRAGTIVRTSGGEVQGRLLIDATGWRAALAGGPASPYVNRRWMAFGIETEVEREFEPGLHFYFLPEVRDGYAWAFPCDGGVRLGVLSYLGRSNLKGALDKFLDRFGVQKKEIHGGFLASGLRAPVEDGVFVTGDAAGQCLPVTGEGIRTAVLAGFACGDLMQKVLDGILSPDQAAAAYCRLVARERRHFRALLWANIAVLFLPQTLIGTMARPYSRPGPLRFFMQHYLGIFRRSLLLNDTPAFR